MMGVRGRNVDDVDVGVLAQVVVGAVCGGGLGCSDDREEFLRAREGGGRSGGNDGVSDVADPADGWIGE